jgi:hypothetical protein
MTGRQINCPEVYDLVPGQVLGIIRKLAERADRRRARTVCPDCGALHLAGGCDVCYARQQVRFREEDLERARRLAAVRRMRGQR